MKINYYSLNLNFEPEALEEIRSIEEEQIIQKFNLGSGRQVSLSRALRDVIGNKLISAGWRANYQMANFKQDGILKWKFEFANFDANTLLDIEVGHNNGIGKKILKAIKMGQLDNTSIYIIVSISEDFKRDGNFDNSASTAREIYNYFMEFKSNIDNPIIIIELIKLDRYFVKSQEDSDGKFGKVVKIL
jgi:hypothetical protein